MRRVLTLTALALFAVSAGAAEVNAQTTILTRAQVIASGASTAYEAVMRLRPEWTSTGLRGGLAVFVNGSNQGTIEALQQIPAELVEQMEFLEGARFNARLTSAGSSGLAAGIFVSTTRAGASASRNRSGEFSLPTPTLVVGIGRKFASGDDWTSGPGGREYEAQPGGGGLPTEVQGTLRVGIPSGYFIEIFYGQELEELEDTFARDGAVTTHLRLTHSARQFGVMFGRGVGPARIGIGAVGVQTEYRSSQGQCYCIGTRQYDVTQGGVATQISYPLPIVRMLMGEARVGARYTPKRDAEVWPGGPMVQLGGVHVSAGIGLGIGPRR